MRLHRMKNFFKTCFLVVQTLTKNGAWLAQIFVGLEYEERSIPASYKFVQAMHKLGNKFVHGVHTLVHFCSMEMLQVSLIILILHAWWKLSIQVSIEVVQSSCSCIQV